MIVEICTPNIQSALNAEAAGAHRIELCENLRDGGTTPSVGTILACKKHLKIPVYVLIRPRGGDFCYSDLEMEVMLNDIDFCKKNGVDGIVIGALHKDRTLHLEQNQAMIAAAGGMGVTFHRAFDRAVEPFKVLEQLKRMNIERILTSGQAESAVKGVFLLKKLIQQSENQLIIMPGAGISYENIQEIIKETVCEEIHLSAKTTVFSKMKKIENDPFLDLDHWESDVETIKKAINATVK